MKRLKNGFTLAEVLITLAIIGIVAAIVVPSVMANYQYKSMGIKLSKFMATTESAARPFVVNNGNFFYKSTGEGANLKTEDNVLDFVNESFIIKGYDPDKDDANQAISLTKVSEGKLSSMSQDNKTKLTTSKDNPAILLKDGTAIQVFIDGTGYATTAPATNEGGSAHASIVPEQKYGVPVFRIAFDPKVQGLPKTAQQVFQFSVTELGYVFPHDKDSCTWYLFKNDFDTKSKVFEKDGVCYAGTSTGTTGL